MHHYFLDFEYKVYKNHLQQNLEIKFYLIHMHKLILDNIFIDFLYSLSCSQTHLKRNQFQLINDLTYHPPRQAVRLVAYEHVPRIFLFKEFFLLLKNY